MKTAHCAYVAAAPVVLPRHGWRAAVVARRSENAVRAVRRRRYERNGVSAEC